MGQSPPDLAACHGEAGDPVGAAIAFEELLPDRLRVLGPVHPSTLLTRRNLAHWREKAQNPALGAQTRATVSQEKTASKWPSCRLIKSTNWYGL